MSVDNCQAGERMYRAHIGFKVDNRSCSQTKGEIVYIFVDFSRAYDKVPGKHYLEHSDRLILE